MNKTITNIDKYEVPIDLRMFVEALLSEEVKGNKVKAEEKSGVNRQNFYNHYKKYPEFRRWYSEQCDHILGMNEAIPPVALLSQIIKGDTQAIRTYYEIIGKLKVKSSVNLGVNIQTNVAVGSFTGEDKQFADEQLARFEQRFKRS